MLWLKGCPRCDGDLVEEKDRYGMYVACVQCGYELTGEQEAVLRSFGRVARAAAGPGRRDSGAKVRAA